MTRPSRSEANSDVTLGVPKPIDPNTPESKAAVRTVLRMVDDNTEAREILEMLTLVAPPAPTSIRWTMHEAGATDPQIAAAEGVTTGEIARWRKRAGKAGNA